MSHLLSLLLSWFVPTHWFIQELYEWTTEYFTQLNGSKTNQVTPSKLNYFYSTIVFYTTVQKLRFFQEQNKLFYKWLTESFTQLIDSNTFIH